MASDDDFDYSSPMKEAAVAMHEMYETLKEVGFSKKEALELIAKMLTSSISDVMSNTDDDDDDE
jgi:hypothetical protein